MLGVKILSLSGFERELFYKVVCPWIKKSPCTVVWFIFVLIIVCLIFTEIYFGFCEYKLYYVTKFHCFSTLKIDQTTVAKQ